MTTTLVILGITNATLLGFVTYLYVVLRKTEKKVKIALEESTKTLRDVYKNKLDRLWQEYKNHREVVEGHEAKLKEFKDALESVPSQITDPQQIVDAFNSLKEIG